MRDFWQETQDLLLKGGAAVAGFLHGMATGQQRSAALLVALMVADYLSGVIAAALGRSKNSTNGRLSSAIGAKGLLRKAVMLLVVGLSFLLDWFVNEGNAMFSTATIWFYISNEGISLLENLVLCGVPVPAKLRMMLEKLSVEESGSLPASEQQSEPSTNATEQNAKPDDQSQG
ncbi:MAG: phage holin family protein [Clostridia bacterium]